MKLNLSEEDRQLVLLALAVLALESPGFDYALNEIAMRIDNVREGRAVMFDAFKQIRATGRGSAPPLVVDGQVWESALAHRPLRARIRDEVLPEYLDAYEADTAEDFVDYVVGAVLPSFGKLALAEFYERRADRLWEQIERASGSVEATTAWKAIAKGKDGTDVLVCVVHAADRDEARGSALGVAMSRSDLTPQRLRLEPMAEGEAVPKGTTVIARETPHEPQGHGFMPWYSFDTRGGWYFNRTDGGREGPFDTREEADKARGAK